jgi:hypothetical protein
LKFSANLGTVLKNLYFNKILLQNPLSAAPPATMTSAAGMKYLAIFALKDPKGIDKALFL